MKTKIFDSYDLKVKLLVWITLIISAVIYKLISLLDKK